MCQLAAFDYYYNRMKKMTLLRMYNKNVGMDLSWLYDPDNILDIKKKKLKKLGLIILQSMKLLMLSMIKLMKLKLNTSITQKMGLFKRVMVHWRFLKD